MSLGRREAAVGQRDAAVRLADQISLCVAMHCHDLGPRQVQRAQPGDALDALCFDPELTPRHLPLLDPEAHAQHRNQQPLHQSGAVRQRLALFGGITGQDIGHVIPDDAQVLAQRITHAESQHGCWILWRHGHQVGRLAAGHIREYPREHLLVDGHLPPPIDPPQARPRNPMEQCRR